MASRVFNQMTMQAGRTEDLTFSVLDKNGDGLEIGADDHIHFRLTATRGGAAVLEIVDGTATAEGSDIAIATRGDSETDPPTAAAGTIQLAEGDTEDFDGLYFAELDLEDAAEADPANAMKPILRGLILFQPNSPLEAPGP